MQQEHLATTSTSAHIRSPRYAVAIPAYNPNDTLVSIILRLSALTETDPAFSGVIVVNDGSRSASAHTVFSKLQKINSVFLLEHDTNLGKGNALKTAFRYVLNEHPEVDFIVTADADGQHAPSDIIKLAHAALVSGQTNIGYRNFSRDVPLRSRFGNKFTAAIFRLVTGQRVYDTQSGLRTYRRDDLQKLVAIPASRYDYELHCLFHVSKRAAPSLEQIPIQTIYEPGNPTSHFNPILDSARIYAVFLRYVSISAISAVLDFTLFSILTLFGVPLLIALIAARICTAPLYFIGMRNIAFQSHGNPALQAAGTILLMAVHVTFLWQFIAFLNRTFNAHPIGAMLAGYAIFYVINFLIQRYIIYPIKKS